MHYAWIHKTIPAEQTINGTDNYHYSLLVVGGRMFADDVSACISWYDSKLQLPLSALTIWVDSRLLIDLTLWKLYLYCKLISFVHTE